MTWQTTEDVYLDIQRNMTDWVDEAQCFCLARRFGAIWSTRTFPGTELLQILSFYSPWCAMPRLL